MCIVTIRGELGSGAPEIGKLVADKLQIDYIDREIIAKIAEEIHRPKQDIEAKEMPPGTLLGRIIEALGHSGYYQAAYLPTWEIPLDDTRYLTGLESVIKELAETGSFVIRGRGSQFILKDFPDAFHVLVVAPLELRMKRVMESLQLDEEAAKKEVERFGSSRHEFTKRYFHAELEDSLNYDLVINTQRLIFEDAASVIATICSQYFTF